MNTHHLKRFGLNIFAAVEVKKLPTDILDMFSKQNIPFTEQDTLCIIGNGGGDLWEQLKVKFKSY